MNRVVLAFAALIAIGAAALHSSRVFASQAPAGGAPKWEYLVELGPLSYDKDMEEKFKRLGAEGWDLVGVQNRTYDAGSINGIPIFKRLKR